MEPENRLLDDFVLSLAKQQPARISTRMAPGLAFLSLAANDGRLPNSENLT